MSSSASALPAKEAPAITPLRLVILVGIITVLGFMLVLRFAAEQERRELLQWQNKLGLIADSRAAAFEGWLSQHTRELQSVAANPSLQLYLTDMLSQKPKPSAVPGVPLVLHEEPAQAVFIRNLLVVTADKMGFLGKIPREVAAIPANVSRPKGVGLAIVSQNGKVLVGTEGLASLSTELQERVQPLLVSTPQLIDMYAISNHNSVSETVCLGFVFPIYAVQADAANSTPIAWLLAIKTLDASFWELLRHPGITESSLEAFLLRKDGADSVTYLPPQLTESSVANRFALNTPELDAAFAITSPGTFSIKKDRNSKEALLTSRTITGSPWTLMVHVDKQQALAESDAWRAHMQFLMVLGILAASASIIAAWWYGTSKRAMALTHKTQQLAAQTLAKEKLLRVVSDHQPEATFILDTQGKILFANAKAASRFGVSATEAFGKLLPAVLGSAAAQSYLEAAQSALSLNKPVSRTQTLLLSTSTLTLKSESIPLSHVPIESLPSPTAGVLVVDQDVTDIVTERERRLHSLHQVLSTLLRMVDERDPYAANHSAAVALLAHEVALAMGLGPEQAATAEMAGKLMNIGKLLVPSSLLTKPASLEENEVQKIRDSFKSSIALLQDIDFDGPVFETLRQAQEHVDGRGEMGLKGNDILITARIINVINSFVGMISPRSYRAAMPIERAIAALLEKSDTQFDRRVTLALANFMENQEGRSLLAGLAMRK